MGKIKTGKPGQKSIKLEKIPETIIQEKIVIQEVEKLIEVPVEIIKEVVVEKIVEVPVIQIQEKIIEKRIEVPMVQKVYIDKPVEVIVEKKIIDIEKLLEAKATIHKKDRAIAMHKIVIAILIIMSFIGVVRG